jgi:hypothetical protein
MHWLFLHSWSAVQGGSQPVGGGVLSTQVPSTHVSLPVHGGVQPGGGGGGVRVRTHLPSTHSSFPVHAGSHSVGTGTGAHLPFSHNADSHWSPVSHDLALLPPLSPPQPTVRSAAIPSATTVSFAICFIVTFSILHGLCIRSQSIRRGIVWIGWEPVKGCGASVVRISTSSYGPLLIG